ncbi:MAG TPA: hypothetical protein VFJ47_01205, partial [Terriglobales bacterium]|nr:hypothetical protein [Terriglobales bacterium]
MSSPPDPFLESPPTGTELPTPELQPASPPPAENPVWTGWDVFSIAIAMLATPAVLYVLILGVAHKFIYRGLPWARVAQKPTLALVAQFLAYIAVFVYMTALVEGKYHIRFLRALGWNWPGPGRERIALAASGVVLLVGLQGLAHLLPIPKNVPFDQLFQHPLDAYLTSIFAITLGPFMEEVFF